MSIAARKYVQMAQKHYANRPFNKRSICVCINLGFTMECWAFFWQLLQSSSKLFKFSRRMLIQRKNFTLSALSWELLNGGYQD